MNERAASLLLVGAAAGAALYWWQRRQGEGAAAPDDCGLFCIDGAQQAAAEAWDAAGNWVAEVSASAWSPPAAAATYLSAIEAAEERYGLPHNMLARLLYQESRFRPEVISGRVRSPAGAVGIAQFMPATAAEYGIDPTDPWSSIDAAGLYLSRLYARFGTWKEALAAYNWGQGNVARKGLDAAPAETRAYFSDILSDLGLA
jgi:soluble lytic murein transglycosylase-like protein